MGITLWDFSHGTVSSRFHLQGCNELISVGAIRILSSLQFLLLMPYLLPDSGVFGVFWAKPVNEVILLGKKWASSNCNNLPVKRLQTTAKTKILRQRGVNCLFILGMGRAAGQASV